MTVTLLSLRLSRYDECIPCKDQDNGTGLLRDIREALNKSHMSRVAVKSR